VSATTGFDVGSRSQSVPVSVDGGHGAGAPLGAPFVDEEVGARGASDPGGDVDAGAAVDADVDAGADEAAGVGVGAAGIAGVCIAGEAGVVAPADVPAPEPQPVSASRTAPVQTASERARARRTPPWSTRHDVSASVRRHDVRTLYPCPPGQTGPGECQPSRRQAQSR
jgi:hypothetical protein